MTSRKLLSRMFFNPEKMNKMGTIVRERIKLDKTKSIITEIKKV